MKILLTYLKQIQLKISIFTETPKSPNLFDLGDNQPVREDSVPEFDFGSETTKKTSKDTILAELADLHGGNSPENEKPAKKEFNIFGKLTLWNR